MPYVDIIHNGVAVGRGYLSDTPDTSKRIYRLGAFVRACTDAEWGVIEELAEGTTAAARKCRRLLALWREEGVNFNDPLTVAAVTWLVSNSGGVWTAQRAQELAG